MSTMIDPSQPDASHIDLYCVNHPDLRWFTKNIECIGARSIFFNPDQGPECACSILDLRVLNPLLPIANAIASATSATSATTNQES